MTDGLEVLLTLPSSALHITLRPYFPAAARTRARAHTLEPRRAHIQTTVRAHSEHSQSYSQISVRSYHLLTSAQFMVQGPQPFF